MSITDTKQNEYVAECKRIILKHVDLTKYAIFLFGSRARKEHRAFADVDIGILGEAPFPIHEITALQETLEASNIPYQVDIIDFFVADEDFKAVALSKIELWNKPKSIKLN